MPKTVDLNSAIEELVAAEVRATLQPHQALLDRLAKFIGGAPTSPARAAKRSRKPRTAPAPKVEKPAKREPRKVRPAKTAARAPTQATAPAKPKSAPKKPGGLLKPMQPDEVLATIVGAKPIALSAVVKKIWVHIKANSLQDPKSGRIIIPDEALGAVFGGKKPVSMFEITRLVSKHLS